MHALVAEAMKKAAIIWVSTAVDQPPYPLWCMPFDGALFAVTGGDEQPAPGLTSADTATVSARGDHGGRIVTWTVRVQTLGPDSADWATIATPLASKRLNATGTADALAATWATASSIARLTPVDDEILALPTGSGAAVPAATPLVDRRDRDLAVRDRDH